MKKLFPEKQSGIEKQYQQLINRKNKKVKSDKGLPYDRYEFPVLTSNHVPLSWRYDFDEKTNPFLLERFSINAVLNPGAIKWKDKYLLMVRVEGVDRKSFLPLQKVRTALTGFNSGTGR